MLSRGPQGAAGEVGRGFASELLATGPVDFWSVAAELSQQGLIRPLARRGIVAQINPAAVIYDAETTVAGTGGPVLNREGRVVAVNAAILPEFGGANIGVPTAHLDALLEEIANP